MFQVKRRELIVLFICLCLEIIKLHKCAGEQNRLCSTNCSVLDFSWNFQNILSKSFFQPYVKAIVSLFSSLYMYAYSINKCMSKQQTKMQTSIVWQVQVFHQTWKWPASHDCDERGCAAYRPYSASSPGRLCYSSRGSEHSPSVETSWWHADWLHV